MASQSPNPFASFMGRIVNAGRCLISGTTFQELLQALSSDRIIAGDGINESPTTGGRVLSVNAAGSEYMHPYMVSMYKNESHVWKVVCNRNDGYLIDNWHYAHREIEGEDKDGCVEQDAPLSDFLVVLRWEYSAYEEPGTEKTPKLIVKSGDPDSFDPFEKTISAADTNGISLCLLAYVHWEGKVPQVVQVVRNNIRVFWALKDGGHLGQLGDLFSAYK